MIPRNDDYKAATVEVEDTGKWRIYEACTFETSVCHDARIRYSGCASVYFG